MTTTLIDNTRLTASTLLGMTRSATGFALAPAARDRLARERRIVEAHIEGGDPVYGLNTGLGGNLGYRLDAAEVQAYQAQIIQGRMIGIGEPMAVEAVRAGLLARVFSLARGGSGVTVAAAQGLVDLLDRGVTPVVPSLGSIGASDLGLCAHMVAPVLGLGEAWFDGTRMPAARALVLAGLAPVQLQAKDGLGLINSSALTAGHAALTAVALSDTLRVAAAVAVLADEAYAANPTVFDPRIAALRPAGAQAHMAGVFRALLQGSSLYDGTPRNIQDAISFRTLAQVFGSSAAAAATLQAEVETELNGSSDNPVVFEAGKAPGRPQFSPTPSGGLPQGREGGDGEGDMLSSPNFHPPALALAFDTMAIAITHLASASVQRAIKLQTPHLSGLPKYLSPVGGASVGYNALQKTAAALYADIRLKAAPASLDAVVVSDTVEDHATQALLCVRKLGEQIQSWRYLLAIEAMVAAQAVDLRRPRALGQGARHVYDTVRGVVPTLQEDRPSGPDAMLVAHALFAGPLALAMAPFFA